MPILPWIQALAGPLLGGLGSGIQSGINAQVARENTDKTIAANKALAEYQYSKDVEMWNRGNVYNSPMEQMARLKSAGLNPNMVYGSGSAAGMSAGQLPKYNAPTVNYAYQPPIDIPSMIGQFQDFRIKNAQVRNTEEAFKARELANELKEDTMWWQKANIKDKAWMDRVKREWFSSGEYTKGMEYQQDYLKHRARGQDLQNARIISATENLDLQNDYFAAKQISNLLGGGVSALKGLQQMFRGGKGALGAGTLPSRLQNMGVQKKLKAVPPGISPNEWFNRLGYNNY